MLLAIDCGNTQTGQQVEMALIVELGDENSSVK